MASRIMVTSYTFPPRGLWCNDSSNCHIISQKNNQEKRNTKSIPNQTNTKKQVSDGKQKSLDVHHKVTVKAKRCLVQRFRKKEVCMLQSRRNPDYQKMLVVWYPFPITLIDVACVDMCLELGAVVGLLAKWRAPIVLVYRSASGRAIQENKTPEVPQGNRFLQSVAHRNIRLPSTTKSHSSAS